MLVLIWYPWLKYISCIFIFACLLLFGVTVYSACPTYINIHTNTHTLYIYIYTYVCVYVCVCKWTIIYLYLLEKNIKTSDRSLINTRRLIFQTILKHIFVTNLRMWIFTAVNKVVSLSKKQCFKRHNRSRVLSWKHVLTISQITV